MGTVYFVMVVGGGGGGSLRGRRLQGKGKGVLGARETRGLAP